MAGSAYVPALGANLTDASVTKNPGSDGVSEYQLPAATLSASRTLILGTSGSPVTNDVVRIVRLDLTANTYLVSDGSSTLFTFPASPSGPTGASFYFNGTAWKFLSAYALDVPPSATTAANGLMSSTDKTKLNGLYRELEGAALTDASPTKNPGSDAVSEYVLPAATLTTNRTLTLGTSGSPPTGLLVRIVRADLTANTYAIVNGGTSGGTIFTFGASPTVIQGLTVFFNSVDWVLVGIEYLAA